MEIEFFKMQGCGDDSILLSAAKLPPQALLCLDDIARSMLDRGFGVGGNSLLVLGHTEEGGLNVRNFTPDGEELPPAGHAMRCAARYAADSGAGGPSAFTIETIGQPSRVQIIDSANVRVDMGMPTETQSQAEIRETPSESYVRSILVDGRNVSYTPISLGRSYAMVFVPDFSFPLNRTARKIAGQSEFPQMTGIGFIQVCSREEIRLRAWESEDEPQADECACAAAAVVASVVNGFTDREVFVRLRGGDVFLQWEESDNRLWLTGPASYVFTGTYEYEEPSKE